MDPLSITASAIAIVQALKAIPTIVEAVRTLAGTKAEVLELLNEVSRDPIMCCA